MQPSLALVYSSQSGDGLYGVGWNIVGLPVITRCPKTVAQDNLAASVFLTSADLYCLNGNKLRLYSGTYGADGAQYQTELADFSLVVSHNTAGTGPAWFEVHGKNGLVYQYGNTTDSALIATGTTSVITWALNRVTDRFGNHIDYAYTNDTTNQTLRITTITYTTPSSTAVGLGAQATANYQVQFSYVSRTSPVPSGFISGAQFMEPYLAQTITIGALSGSTYPAVKTYNLAYTTGGATGRSLLNTVTECSPTQCFSPTTVTYQSGSTGWAAGISIGGASGSLWTAMVGDLNGDGIDDILYVDKTTNHLYYLLGSSSGTYAGPYDTGLTTYVALIDYNGDGKTDILTVNSSGNFRINSFSTPGGALTTTDTTTPAPTGANSSNVLVGDVDGDGRDDLIYAVSGGSGWQSPDSIYYRLNTGSGFGSPVLIKQIGSSTCTRCQKLSLVPFGEYTHYNSRVRRMDVNGDGRLDFFVDIGTCVLSDQGVCSSPTYLWQLAVSDSSTNSYDFLDSLANGPTGPLEAVVPPLVGDFNGDGCEDVAYANAGVWYVQYGTCLRNGSSFALSAAVNTGITNFGIYPVALDWDGDGRDDIVSADSTTGHIGYMHSTGTTFGAWTSTGIPYTNSDTTNYAAIVVDVHGDGQYGIVYPAASSTLTAYAHNGTGVTQDLATSFVDGFGYAYSPSYGQITSSTLYTKNTGASYPEQDYQGAQTVVSSYTVSDGVTATGTYNFTQHYYWARLNIAGRGFEGYGAIRSIDSRNGLYTFNYYSQLFPNTGMVSASTLSNSSGTTYRAVNNTNTSNTLDATHKRYFPYVSQSVGKAYELGGALDGTLITQTTTTFSYAGPNGFTYGNPSQVSTTTIDEDPTSPWTGKSFVDTVNLTPYEQGVVSGTVVWCIHLPSQVSEQRTQPSGVNLTHTASYSVNSNGECEVDSQTVEPSSTTGDKIATVFSYTDGCGNVNSITITGQNPDGSTMTGRTSTAAYAAHCIYPETVKNALAQASALGYRYDLGLPASLTDPNDLATSWTFNDVGQETLEQRPDGTQTAYVRLACNNTCGVDLQYDLQTQEQDATPSHTTYRTVYRYYDQLDRLQYTEAEQSNGQLGIVRTIFDSLGRVSQKSNPYGNGFGTFFTTYNYDLLNRLTSVSSPTDSTHPALKYTYYTYQGRTQTVQDPKGYTTTNQSDVLGELSIVKDPDGTSKTNYSYNPFGQLTLIQDPAGNQTSRTFDTLGYLLTATSDPDRGTWTYQFDSLGELLNVRDAKTTAPTWTQQLTYDALGRILTRLDVSEGVTTHWTWGTSQPAHEIGQLAGLSGFGDTETYTFDSAGRPYTRSMVWNGQTYTVTYTYNNQGKLDQLMYPLAPGQVNAFAVKYGYTNGYLSSLQNYTGGVGGTTFWQLTPSVVNMDPWGHVVDETLGTTSTVRIQSAYDAVTSWQASRTVGSGGSLTNLDNLAFQWDLNGNLSQRQDVTNSLTEALTYDNLNRIQNSTLNGTTQILAMLYDNTGNITSRTEYGTAYPYTYDTVHTHGIKQLGSPAVHTYTYDANGNMASRDSLGFVWASYNLPTSLTSSGVSANFYYGPDRQRKEQVSTYNAEGDSGTETTTYVFGLYEHESTPAQTHDKYFVQVPGGTQVIYDIQSVSGTQTTYITADHLGSANLMINAAGSMILRESYGAFGRRRASNWASNLTSAASDYTTIASTTRRGYTDGLHEYLDNVTLIHMNGRLYDPVAGRFLSPDPVVTRIGDSQRGNSYSYVENGPLTMTDPTGFDGCTASEQNCKPNNPPPPPPPPFTGGVPAGMYASMLGIGSYSSYAAAGAAYNLANGLTGLGTTDPGSEGTKETQPALQDGAPPSAGPQQPPAGVQQPATQQGQTGNCDAECQAAVELIVTASRVYPIVNPGWDDVGLYFVRGFVSSGAQFVNHIRPRHASNAQYPQKPLNGRFLPVILSTSTTPDQFDAELNLLFNNYTPAYWGPTSAGIALEFDLSVPVGLDFANQPTNAWTVVLSYAGSGTFNVWTTYPGHAVTND